MELRKSWDLRKIVTVLYVLFLAVYLAVGLQPAEAAEYDISTDIYIPAIKLSSDVTTLHFNDASHSLDTPDTIVGRFTWSKNKTLLVGHASTVFRDLKFLNVGDKIHYDEIDYSVTKIEVMAKSDINMLSVLSEAEKDTIVIMTCSGQNLGGGDATHRLMVTAVANV